MDSYLLILFEIFLLLFLYYFIKCWILKLIRVLLIAINGSNTIRDTGGKYMLCTLIDLFYLKIHMDETVLVPWGLLFQKVHGNLFFWMDLLYSGASKVSTVLFSLFFLFVFPFLLPWMGINLSGYADKFFFKPIITQGQKMCIYLPCYPCFVQFDLCIFYSHCRLLYTCCMGEVIVSM